MTSGKFDKDTWKWLDLSPMGYTNWGIGMPTLPSQSDDESVELDDTIFFMNSFFMDETTSDFVFFNGPSTEKLKYICSFLVTGKTIVEV